MSASKFPTKGTPSMKSEKYIGLDVHQATISVAVLDSTGKLVSNRFPSRTGVPSIPQCFPRCRLLASRC